MFATEEKLSATRKYEACFFSDKVGGRLFISVMKCKGPRTEPWGNTCFNIPQYEKILSIVR